MKTYGTADLIDGYWHLKVEAHVAMRLKRVFGRIGKGRLGTLKVKATDEVSRDLQWFCERFPLIVKQPADLEQRATRHKRDGEMFEQLITGAIEPKKFDLAIPARDYQRVAAALGHGATSDEVIAAAKIHMDGKAIGAVLDEWQARQGDGASQ